VSEWGIGFAAIRKILYRNSRGSIADNAARYEEAHGMPAGKL
jgi:hypothetical protein